MKKLRKTNGITLITLIITILVLLIIAGVVIGTINGGILGNANKSAEKYNNEARKEDELLGALENKLKDYTGETPSTPDQPTKEPTNVEYFSWTTTENEATITGFSDVGKEKYNAGEITELVIPSEYNGVNVTTIQSFAFGYCSSLKEVYINKEITSAGNAFQESGIEKVTFEEGMEKIPAGIMKFCRNLNEIVIPNSVKTIGENAFSNCYGLETINIPHSVTTIQSFAFGYCTSLTTVNFRGTQAQWSAISIGNNNTPLTSATINYNQ